MVEALLKHGADRAPQSDDGTTPADLARKHGHDQIVNLLG
jgi:ankyrin repeat protein